MSKDYLDSVYYIRKSQRDDYTKGVLREYDVYLEGEVIWTKFKPNFTYKVRVTKNSFDRYVIDFENSDVIFVPPKKDKDDGDVTLENLYISNILGKVTLDYDLCGEGRIDIDDYLALSVKCDSLIIKNCNTLDNVNLFNGIIANDMEFINCNMKCYTKNNYIDSVNSIILSSSSLECNLYSFINFNKIILDSSSLIFESNKSINLYAKNISMNSSMLGFKTSISSRVIFKYLECIDSKINSSNCGLIIQGIKKSSFVNSVVGNNSYNNDITINEIEKDKLSIIYNNVSDRNSISYTGFMEKYRSEVRGLYVSGSISEFDYNRIVDDLDSFLDSLSDD